MYDFEIDGRRIRGAVCRGLLTAVFAFVSVGCGDAAGTDRTAERRQPIENGTVDSAHRGVVVYLIRTADNGLRICSGTLVARNLVLTARHCVAPLENTKSGSVRCGQTTFGATDSPSRIPYVSTDTDIRQANGLDPSPSLERSVDQIWTPSTDAACRADLALLRLSRGIPNSDATPIDPRLGGQVQVGEKATVVGYGNDGEKSKSGGVRRKKSGLDVQFRCDNDVCRTSEDSTGETVQLGRTEFLTDGGPCLGDSGGPALDSKGRAFGIIARGTPGCDWEVFVSTREWKSFLRESAFRAAAAGGYRTPGWANLRKDRDGDGIHDDYDNCPRTPNTSQTESDSADAGVACTNPDGSDAGTDTGTVDAGDTTTNDREADASDADAVGDTREPEDTSDAPDIGSPGERACGCTAAGGAQFPSAAFLLVVILAAARRDRRRRVPRW